MITALAGFTVDVSATYAQSSNCTRLNQQLRTLDRNGDFRNVSTNSNEAQSLAAALQDAESAYVRGGCSDMVRNGQTLTRECQTLARQIIRGREDLEDLSQDVETGNDVAAQREAILQEISRFGCNSRDSEVTFSDTDDDGFSPQRQTLFDRIFGTYTEDPDYESGDIYEDDFSGYGNYTTIRTVCVRLSDGYFWPVSYSTLPDYINLDAQQCSLQCPGTPTSLYYYENPGQEAEQMVSLTGEPYMALPNAFRYRTEFDKASTCKVPVDQGSIIIVSEESGESRAVIEFKGATFPLPLRDPRRSTAVTVAEVTADSGFVSMPLPRKRPIRDGEFVPVQAVVQPEAEEPMRLVQFGDKVVRVVGPDTPYAQPTGEGT
jgi:hypothetical protein